MDDVCQDVRRRYAAQGFAAFASDAAGRRHLLECAECWSALPGATSAQPGGQPEGKEELESSRFARSLRTRRGRLVAWLIGAAALVIACVGVWAAMKPRYHAFGAVANTETTEEETPEWLDDSRMDDEEGGHGRRHKDDEGQMDQRATGNRFGIEGPENNEDPHMAREEARQAAANAGIIDALQAQRPNLAMPSAAREFPAKGAPASAQEASAEPRAELGNDPMSGLGALMGDQIGSNFGFGGLGLRGSGYGSGAGGVGLGTIGHGAGGGVAEGRSAMPRVRIGRERDKDRGADRPSEHAGWKTAADRQLKKKVTSGEAMPARVSSPPASHAAQSRPHPQVVAKLAAVASESHADDRPAPPPPANAAAELLARYSTLEGAQFIDPNGYFANTYVPGDPELRVLQSRLQGYDRASLLPESVRSARLDDGSHRNAQPFDPPGHAALAVYLSASERGITAARRMLVQVGLQATPRYSGRRPAMNIGLVLDAREPLAAAASANVRALLAAFADARDLGDKLALFAAGPGGGQLVAADAFRHGPLTVALQRMTSERSGTSVSLPDALQRALQSVRGGDDPNAPLGSSVVIVVAPAALGADLSQLEALAHQSAVEGVPVSVFGAGAQADPEELARLALAGQGNRRMLAGAGDALPAVDRELSAVARVVARAVRLRIKLAAGVRLISVLGSHPLDEVHAERVREAENSIDQRLSRNLGIQQDRGEDEEGVQIVIPSFYAGDSHTILLDVVAEAPGPIADVTVRYKDLVQLGNGNARQSLWLPNLELARGALQRNVLKNLVSFELSRLLDGTGDLLAGGTDVHAAQGPLSQALALLDSLGTAVPELRADRELEADRALTAEYLALLAQIDGAPQRQFAADSLHFASLLKLQPRPEWDSRAE